MSEQSRKSVRVVPRAMGPKLSVGRDASFSSKHEKAVDSLSEGWGDCWWRRRISFSCRECGAEDRRVDLVWAQNCVSGEL